MPNINSDLRIRVQLIKRPTGNLHKGWSWDCTDMWPKYNQFLLIHYSHLHSGPTSNIQPVLVSVIVYQLKAHRPTTPRIRRL